MKLRLLNTCTNRFFKTRGIFASEGFAVFWVLVSKLPSYLVQAKVHLSADTKKCIINMTNILYFCSISVTVPLWDNKGQNVSRDLVFLYPTVGQILANFLYDSKDLNFSTP